MAGPRCDRCAADGGVNRELIFTLLRAWRTGPNRRGNFRVATRRISAEERAQATEPEAEFLEYSADLNYDADTEEALHKLRDTFAGTDTKGTMWVYRLPLDDHGEVVGNAKPSMCFNAPLDRYELEELSSKLRTEYMKAGERAIFRVTATVRGTAGMKLNRLLILQRENESAEPVNARESFGDLLRIVQESNAAAAERSERLFASITARQVVTPAIDPIDQSMRMMAAMTGLTQSLVMRTSGAPAADPMTSLQSTLAVLKQMRGFFGDGSSSADGGDPDSIASIFRAAAPIASTIGELLKRAPVYPMLAAPSVRRRRPGQVPAGVATVPGAQPAVAAHAPDPIVLGIRQMLAQIRPQIDAMIQSAAQGAEPAAVAELVLEAFVPDSPEERRFMSFIEREDWWQLLAGVNPAVVPHQAWFTNLRGAILAAFEPEEPAAPGA